MNGRQRTYNNELDETKKWYLSEMEKIGYDELTIRTHENFLHRIRNFEINYMNDKKIQEFNYEEIILLFKSLGSGSIGSLKAYSYIIDSYFDFCKKESKMDNVIDWMRVIDSQSLKRCLNKEKFNNKFITREDLYNLIENLINNYDKAILLLVFEGVMGKGYSDLINLKVSDLDFKNNTIHLKNKKIFMSDKLKEILEQLINEDSIFCVDRWGSKIDLLNMDSEYVLKPTYRYLELKSIKKKIEDGEYDSEKISAQVLSNRVFKILKKYINAPYLTLQNIFKSGIIERVINKIGVENVTRQNFVEEAIKISGYSSLTCDEIYKIFIDEININNKI